MDNIDKKFDQILATELEKRLNRKPKVNELINADFDSDLVNECLWQLVKELTDRVDKLENNIKK